MLPSLVSEGQPSQGSPKSSQVPFPPVETIPSVCLAVHTLSWALTPLGTVPLQKGAHGTEPKYR